MHLAPLFLLPASPCSSGHGLHLSLQLSVVLMSFGLLILQSWISCWIVEMRIFNDFQTIVYQRNCPTFKAIPPKKSGGKSRAARAIFNAFNVLNLDKFANAFNV